jgi:hypothetical protein
MGAIKYVDWENAIIVYGTIVPDSFDRKPQ